MGKLWKNCEKTSVEKYVEKNSMGKVWKIITHGHSVEKLWKKQCEKNVEKITREKCGKYLEKNVKKNSQKKWGKNEETKCEENVKNQRVERM